MPSVGQQSAIASNMIIDLIPQVVSVACAHALKALGQIIYQIIKYIEF